MQTTKTSNLYRAGLIGGKGKRVEQVIAIDKMIRAIQVFGSVEAAAPHLGVSRMAIFRALERTGSPPLERIVPPKHTVDGTHTSRVAEWIRTHQGRSIPRSMKALADAAGVTIDAAKSYLKRRRRLVLEKLEALPDLRKVRLSLVNLDDVVRGTNLIRRYAYKVDRYAMSCRIDAVLKNGSEETFPIPDLNAFVKNVKAAGV